MSDKKRKKKDHADVGKKLRRRRTDERARRNAGAQPKKTTDEVDTVKFKPGSASDDSRTAS
jgi:hypothetical protein